MSGYGAAAVHFLRASATHAPEISYTVLTTDAVKAGPELTLSNSTIVRIRIPSFLPGYIQLLAREIILYRRIRAFNRLQQPTVIFFETLERTICLWLLSHSLVRRKLVIRIHGTTEMESFCFNPSLQYRVRNFLARKVLKHTPHILSTTPAYIEFCKQHFFDGNVLKYGNKLFGVVRNTVTPTESIRSASPTVLNQWSVSPNKFFLSVGRMDREGSIQKGFVDLIAAISLAVQKSPETMRGFRFVLVGDGSERLHLQNFARRTNIEHLCVFIPALPNEDIHTLARYTRAAVFPSRFEGVAIFALECLSTGTPLVFSNAGGNADIVRESCNGYVVRPQDTISLADAILNMAQASTESIRGFQINSVKHFEEKFSPARVIADWISYVFLIENGNYR